MVQNLLKDELLNIKSYFCKKFLLMNFKLKSIAFAILVLVVSCAKNPFTGKSTMALVPNSQVFHSAFQQ